MRPSMVVKIWVPYKAKFYQKLDSHGSWLSTLGYCVNFTTYCFQKTLTRSRPLEYLSAYQGFCRWWQVSSCADDEVQWQTHSVMNYSFCKWHGNKWLVPGFRFSRSTGENMYNIPSTLILFLFVWSRYVFDHRLVSIFIHTGTWDTVYLWCWCACTQYILNYRSRGSTIPVHRF
jgi:hypothetical protein